VSFFTISFVFVTAHLSVNLVIDQFKAQILVL